MEFWYLWVIPVVGGLILYLIMHFAVRTPGMVLQQKFVKLGTLKDKTLQEISAACGMPNSVSYGNDGIKICQWMATGYHIVLLFDANDICLGVSNETKV